MSELTVVEPPMKNGGQEGRPIGLKPLGGKPRPGVALDKLTLGECEVVVQRPEKLTKATYDDLDSMFQLILRNASRAISDGNETSEDQ